MCVVIILEAYEMQAHTDKGISSLHIRTDIISKHLFNTGAASFRSQNL